MFFLVEQEADHNKNRLMDHFIEGLHYYSAIFDSVDVSYGALSSDQERLAQEEMLRRENESIVTCEGLEREEGHERHQLWLDLSSDDKDMFDTLTPGWIQGCYREVLHNDILA